MGRRPAPGHPPGGDPSGSATAEDRVLAAIDDDATVALLVRLVRAVSEDPPGDEAAAAAVVAETLTAAGIPCRLREVMPGRPDVHATIGTGPRPCLVFNGHLDTMPAGPGWTAPPFAAAIADGRLVGRGAADAKGGLAAMVAAMVALHRAGVALSGRLALHAVIDEEAGGAGTRAAVEEDPGADWAIVAEPTGLGVARASNGQVDVRVRFAGRAAHGSTPEAGRSAIADAARFVDLVGVRHRELATGPAHPLTGAASILVGTIAGGVQTSIVPPVCELTLDRRLIPGEETSAALDDVDRLLADLEADRPGVRAERETFLVVPPSEVEEDAPVVRELARAVTQVTARHEPITGLRATSDAATYAASGIPAVVFGPGSLDVAHRPDESVPLDEVLAAARILALAALRLLA